MVSNKSAKKARKPIVTTLGKAPTKPKEKDPDVSHLRRPIETSISGIKQILSILETATNEVKHVLMYECDIMYECRTCRTIFRSLANFILHKRNYCKDKFSPSYAINNNDAFKVNIKDSPKEPKIHATPLNKVIAKLHEIDRVRESAKQLITVDLTNEPDNEPVKSMDLLEEKTSKFNKIVLERISSNGSGVFQTLDSSSDHVSNSTKRNQCMKAEVMELHKKIENDVPVLDSEGRICGFTSSQLNQSLPFPKSQFKCTECNNRFVTQKSLTNHVKYVHNPSRIVYICPTCKDTFANPWCVYRHLLKVHRMTNKQVRRMREQVHNSWIRRSEEPSVQKKKPPGASQSSGDSENQWINDIEGDNDLQMCAGCGKHFERKAALHSHSQLCAKRLEVCNSIKENAKKKGEDEKGKLDNTTDGKMGLKGASKRKGQNIYTYRRKPNESSTVDGTCELDKTNASSTKSNDMNVILNVPRSNHCENIQSVSSTKTIIKYNEEETTNISNDDTIKVQSPKKSHTCLKPNETSESHPMFVSVKETKSDILEGSENRKIRDTSSAISEDLFPEEKSRIDLNVTLPKEKKKNLKTRVSNSAHDEYTARRSRIVGKCRKQTSRNHLASNNVPVKLKEFSDSSMVISSTTDLCTDGELARKQGSNSLVDSTESPMHSRPSSFEISRFNSTEEIICLDSSDDSLQDNLDVRMGSDSLPLPEIRTGSDSLPLPIKREKLEPEEKCRLSMDFVHSSISECVISEEQKNADTVLQEDSFNLLSNKVTFEMFCKKVEQSNESINNVPYINSSIKAKRKRKLEELEDTSESVENSADAPKCSDDEGDVIYVSETKKTTTDTFIEVENGFPGFSSEEKSSFSIDFSNLSYNNPLKSKRRSSTPAFSIKTLDSVSCDVKIKMEDISIESEPSIPKELREELHFIQRADSYMDREKLMCIPCDLTFESFTLLIWHMSAHFSWFRFQCSKCSFIAFEKNDCRSHVEKCHKLNTTMASSYILPLPNWKTVLMSHEFRLLNDCNDLRGKHTDEKIGIDENLDQHIKSVDTTLKSEDLLCLSLETLSTFIPEKDNSKKRNKCTKGIIDIQETIQDFHQLPEPVELKIPADVSEVFRTFTFDEEVLSPVETIEELDCADESNDDWGLSKLCKFEEPVKTEVEPLEKDSDEGSTKEETSPQNTRPSRIRTKVKPIDDFVYYDNDVNNVLKVTELFKNSSQKHRPDNAVNIKPKVSSKSVPTTQKKEKFK